MGPSHKADASLRLHVPSLSLVPQRKRGRKKGKTKCPINSVTLVGFVGSDPELRQAKGNGSNFTVISVATQRSWKNADDEWSSKTEWHRIVLFRPRLADHVASTIKKGAKRRVMTEPKTEKAPALRRGRIWFSVRMKPHRIPSPDLTQSTGEKSQGGGHRWGAKMCPFAPLCVSLEYP